MTGATGPTGFRGLQGATGVTGFRGSVGRTGATGLTGVQGVRGVVGDTGLTGFRGSVGLTGATGLVGLAGAPGRTGSQGVTGAAGAAGGTGSQGVSGAAGAAGAAGGSGSQGVQGASGVTGEAGLAGAPGRTGSQGVTGAAGAAGLAGVQGASGGTGANGATGVEGDRGVQGATGLAGPVGSAGASAATGPTGAAGWSGQQGPTGAAGGAGITGPAYLGWTGMTGTAGPPGLGANISLVPTTAHTASCVAAQECMCVGDLRPGVCTNLQEYADATGGCACVSQADPCPVGSLTVGCNCDLIQPTGDWAITVVGDPFSLAGECVCKAYNSRPLTNMSDGDALAAKAICLATSSGPPPPPPPPPPDMTNLTDFLVTYLSIKNGTYSPELSGSAGDQRGVLAVANGTVVYVGDSAAVDMPAMPLQPVTTLAIQWATLFADLQADVMYVLMTEDGTVPVNGGALVTQMAVVSTSSPGGLAPARTPLSRPLQLSYIDGLFSGYGQVLVYIADYADAGWWRINPSTGNVEAVLAGAPGPINPLTCESSTYSGIAEYIDGETFVLFASNQGPFTDDRTSNGVVRQHVNSAARGIVVSGYPGDVCTMSISLADNLWFLQYEASPGWATLDGEHVAHFPSNWTLDPKQAVICPPGTFLATGDASCAPCSVGAYCPGGAQVVPEVIPCPSGLSTPDTGASSVDACSRLCPPGYYALSSDVDALCLECGYGYACPGGAQPTPQREACPEGTTTALPTAGAIIQCVPGVVLPYTGALQTVTVPAGYDTMAVQLWGGQGGGAGCWSCGGGFGVGPGGSAQGGYAVATLGVTGGDAFDVYVGGRGVSATPENATAPGGFNGGGPAGLYAGSGGGASDVRPASGGLDYRLLVAGGGGGGACTTDDGCGNYYDQGGAGGGDEGADGTGYYGGSPPGTGGDKVSGGTTGTPAQCGPDGVAGTGGSNGVESCAGGGGGWYGGGGAYRAGGGGGSGYASTTATSGGVLQEGVRIGDGLAVVLFGVAVPDFVVNDLGSTDAIVSSELGQISGNTYYGGPLVSTNATVLKAFSYPSDKTLALPATELAPVSEIARAYPGLVVDMATDTTYVLLAADGTPMTYANWNYFEVAALGVLSTTGGGLTGEVVTLSRPLRSYDARLLFSGYGQVVFFNYNYDVGWWRVDLPSGLVVRLQGPNQIPFNMAGGYYGERNGIAESYAGETYILYVANDGVRRSYVRSGLSEQVLVSGYPGEVSSQIALSLAAGRWFMSFQYNPPAWDPTLPRSGAYIAGWPANWTTSPSPTTCSPGSFLPAGQANCVACDVGSYCPGGGQVVPKHIPCPSGLSTPDTGASSVDACSRLCPPGYYALSSNVDALCLECGPDAYCPGGFQTLDEPNRVACPTPAVGSNVVTFTTGNVTTATSRDQCLAVCEEGFALDATANTCTACTTLPADCDSGDGICFGATTQQTCAACAAGFALDATANTCREAGNCPNCLKFRQ